jgi:hypothetical protein
MHLGITGLVGILVEDGALMIVASTIVPVATFSPLAAKCRCTSSKQPPAQIVRFEQMAETAHRGFVKHRLAAEIDPDKTADRHRIVERLFHRRVRQVEPYVDGPLLARVFRQCSDQIACVHMSGLLSRSHLNAGQDGFRDTSSKHCCGRQRPMDQAECLVSWIDRSHHLLVSLQVLASAQHGCS